MAAPKKGRRSPGAQGRPGRALAVIVIAIVALTGGMFLSGHTTPRLGIDLAGGTSFTLEARNQPGRPNAINSHNMNTAKDIMDRRVNGLGVSEAEVETQGDRHIIVNIPKGTNAKQARQQVGTTAQLFFRPVTSFSQSPKPEGAGSSPSPGSSASSGAHGTSGKSSSKGSSTKSTGKGSSSGSTATPTATAGGGKNAPKTDEEARKPASDSGSTASSSSSSSSTSPSASASSSSSAPPSTSQNQSSATGTSSAALTKRFAALDCSTKQARSKASRQAADAKPSDPIVACDQQGQGKYILGPSAVAGTQVSKASSVYDTQNSNGWEVELEFNGKGSSQFANITGKLAGKQAPQNQFGIVLDGEVVSAPSVDESITGGRATISGGNFTQQSSRDLANVLSYGALPLSFDIVDQTTVSQALGSEQLDAGLTAGAIGMALVVLYMVTYYRGLSLVAMASLLVSAILSYSIMVLLGPGIGFALSLPAVCGAIVAIGITADSFIVYFERIRDEIREGRSLRPAVERGWPRARRTILVSDFVSFLAAAVLYVVTVGTVQGFAFTLGLTTLLDIAVVFLFTKPLMTLLARRRFFASGHPWSGLDPRRLGAKPPLRRRSAPPAPADPKEA